MINPTHKVYNELSTAYAYFNKHLFENRLPNCLITVQRKKSALGYFSPNRFGEIDSEDKVDEIAMNPIHFKTRTLEQTLSTLAHEMTHLEQEHFGVPGKKWLS